MLLATSPDIVEAMTLSVTAGEFGITPFEWRDIAPRMAAELGLRVTVSELGGKMRIRFTRDAVVGQSTRITGAES
jgi:hypothetical protein